MSERGCEYIEGYRPGYLGRVAELHGIYYSKAWGSGAEFEGMMAQEMREWFRDYREDRDLFLTAHVDGVLVGSISVQGGEWPAARIRWVILDEAYHGRGIGKELLSRALEFSRRAGFSSVYLWTVEGLPASRSLYEKAGFEVVDRVPDDRYSVPRVNLRFELRL